MKHLSRAATATGPAVLVAALLAVFPTTGTIANADPGPSAASVSAGDARAPAARRVFRRYGGRAVRQAAWKQTVKITFRGRADDVVGARTGAGTPGCQRVRLATRAGTLVRQARSDFWVLPERGRYVLTYEQDCVFGDTGGDDPAPPYRRALSVQLLKVRTHRLAPGDGLLTLPVERGYVDVAELRLAGRRPVSVEVTNHPEQGLLGGEINRIITPSSTPPVRAVGQVVDGDQCSEKSPLTIEAGERVTGSTYYLGADGLYAEPGRTLFCDRDARYHVAERGDTFWFFNEERPLELEAARLR